VIPTYNCAQWIGQALDSVLAQTLPPAEVIVVDDGSKDDTSKVMERYVARGVQYIHQPNSGVAAARNRGIAQSSGELIAFLDADDTWHPRKLEVQVPVLVSRPELGLLASALFDATDAPPRVGGDEAAVTIIPWRDLLVKNYFATSSILARRQVIEAAGEGPFDTALQGPEDHDLWIRMAEVAKVGKLELPVTGYRSVPGSLSKNPTKMETGMLRILSKAQGRQTWKVQGSRRLRQRAGAYVRCSCAQMYRSAGHPWQGTVRLLQSIGTFPFPFHRRETNATMLRPRLLAVTLLRAMGLQRSQ
jgi:hypothetical protein